MKVTDILENEDHLAWVPDMHVGMLKSHKALMQAILHALKGGNETYAKALIASARKAGRDNPEFKVIEKSLGIK